MLWTDLIDPATLTGLHVDGIRDQARLGLDREPSGDLLALRRARHEHRRGAGRPDELGEQLGLRHDEVTEHVVTLDAVDLLRAVLRERLLGGVEPAADEHRRRLAEAAGDRQQPGAGG